MKRSSLRAFGIACFVIGLVLTLSEKVNLPIVSSANINEEQYKTEIARLEKQLTDANEQISQLEQTQQVAQSPDEDAADDKVTEPEETLPTADSADEGITGTLYIYGGLTPAEVAQKIKDLGIIKNSIEMELFLAQPEYAKSIQKGQFELNSSMTVEEIANTITGKTLIE